MKNASPAFADYLGLWEVLTIQQNPNVTTIVCDGMGGIQVQLGKNQRFPCNAIRDCAIAHEESHKAEALNQNPWICIGQPAGTAIVASFLSDGTSERPASEVAGYNAEVKCLEDYLALWIKKDQKGDCKNECPRAQIDYWLNLAKRRANEWSQADPKNIGSWPEP